MAIHPTAIIDKDAEIDPTVEIGPYCIIGAGVKIAANNKIESHCVFQGPTRTGESNHFYPFCMIGLNPQFVGYKGEPSLVKIGENNVFREMVQVHRSIKEGGETLIGNSNFFMGNVHIAHDCILQNNIIMANHATLAGHVEIMDNAFLSGFVGITQFRKIGSSAILSVHSRIVKDIPPYVIAAGHKGQIVGLNIVGVQRAGIDSGSIRQIKRAYKLYFRSGLSISQAHEKAPEELDMNNPCIKNFINFIKESKNGIAAFEDVDNEEI